MPLLGKADPPPQQPLFYKSLQELDEWSPGGQYDGIIKFKPRTPAAISMNRGKLLVRIPLNYQHAGVLLAIGLP